MNIYRQVYFLRLKILHTHNRQQIKNLKSQLIGLIAQLPIREEQDQEEFAECL